MKLKERLSVQIAKRPGRVVLFGILLFNIVFFFISVLIISNLSLTGTEKMNFFQAAFSTITMILDPGCVQFVVEDIGQMGVAVALICLLIIFIGMISFTGAVIGYITNTISRFIDDSNTGTRMLHISNHFVILNWNTRASEIINDLLYCDKKQRVVVLVSGRKAEIEKEISDRLADTVRRENRERREKYGKSAKKFKNKVTVIVREGDVFSSKQLHDISLEKSRIIVILGNDINNSNCKYEDKDVNHISSKGNYHTIKTLMQVADITSSEDSVRKQRIVVEITDKWTRDLVDSIIKCKQKGDRCDIIPVEINTILGQILSQFSLMPELNIAYRNLFSNKGTTFYAEESPMVSDTKFIREYFKNHCSAIPLTHMKSKDGKTYAYYTAERDEMIYLPAGYPKYDYKVKLNKNYWIEQKTVVILGHNSRCHDIMEGFVNFTKEWKRDDCEILRITVIDDEENLREMNYYKEYPFVVETIPASIYDREVICSSIERIVSNNPEDTSILILSNDMAASSDIDANALANLVYVQDIIEKKRKTEGDAFDEESIDVIVEIVDPKHHDVVSSYSIYNVVISNRYISKMITQIGEKEALFEFYQDMLTYDSDESNGFESKEIYAKKVSSLFDEIPEPCTAAELIRAVFEASVSEDIPEDKRYPAIALGYVKHGEGMILFGGDQTKINVELHEKDKLIIYSVH